MSRNRDYDEYCCGSCWSSLCMCIFIGLVIIGLEWLVLLIVVGVYSSNGTVKESYFIVVLCWFLIINVVTFLVNALDKGLAKCFNGNDRVVRVPEKVLHFFTLVGGAPATSLAMLIVRHKCAKDSYRRVFVMYAVISFFVVGVGFGVGYAVAKS